MNRKLLLSAAIFAGIIGTLVGTSHYIPQSDGLSQVSNSTYLLANGSPFYGRSDGWYIEKTSPYDFHLIANGTSIFEIEADGDFVSGGDITFENGASISNATNGAIAFSEAGEDWKLTFTNNLVTASSTTGATYAFTPAVAFADSLTLSDGLTIDQAANNDMAITENSEDWVSTFSTDLVTFSSTTGATFAFTPNVGFTGDITVTGNDITFGNAGTLSNATNGAITMAETSEDWINTFTSNVMTWSSSTGVDTINLTALKFGFTVAAAGNQACDTTCSGGKKCQFGWDQGTTVFVACNSALADTCVCSTT